MTSFHVLPIKGEVKGLSPTWSNVNKKTVMHRRRAVAESDNSSSDCGGDGGVLLHGAHKNAGYCKNCCSCSRTSTGPKKKSKSKERPPRLLQHDLSGTSSYRDQLEMKVLNDELSEQMSHDAHKGVRHQHDHMSDMLSALRVFIQCLDMKNKSMQRLLSLLTPEENPTLECFDPLNVKLSEVRLLTMDGSGDMSITNDLDTYTSKHSDFLKASANFASILQNSSRVSNQHLKKLESQFNNIRSDYSQAKTILDSKLNDLVQMKAEVINKCFQRLLPVLVSSADLEKQMIAAISDVTVESLKRNTESTRSINIISKNHGHGDDNRRKSCTCLDPSR